MGASETMIAAENAEVCDKPDDIEHVVEGETAESADDEPGNIRPANTQGDLAQPQIGKEQHRDQGKPQHDVDQRLQAAVERRLGNHVVGRPQDGDGEHDAIGELDRSWRKAVGNRASLAGPLSRPGGSHTSGGRWPSRRVYETSAPVGSSAPSMESRLTLISTPPV